MQIIPIEDKVQSLLVRLNTKIYLTCSDKIRGMKLLESIDLKLIAKPYYSESDSTFEIIPHRANREISMNTFPAELREIVQAQDDEIKLTFVDFEGSDGFYAAIAKKNSPLKIIKDEFSVQRSAPLFQYLSKIELDLRQAVYRNRHSINADAPSAKRGKTPDDTISQYDLTEIMNKHLLKPSSDKYFLSQLNAAGDDKELILQARKSLVINELEMPFTPEEYTSFIKVRNAVMHFKVVTFSDVQVVIRLHEKLMQYGILKLATRVADGEFDHQPNTKANRTAGDQLVT